MTKPEQKADELQLLEMLRDHVPILEDATIHQPDPPEPDGVFGLPGGSAIAVELTEYVRDPNETGGTGRQHEVRQAQSLMGPEPALHIRVHWSAPPTPWTKTKAVGEALVRTVQPRVPPPANGNEVITVEIQWEELDPFLQDLVNSILVHRTPGPTAGGWGAPSGGIIYTDPNQIQGRIDRKAGKLVYARPGRPNWLLIHGSGIEITGAAEMGHIASHIFQGPFDRLFLHEPFLGLRELSIQP